MKKLSPFAWEVERINDSHLSGTMLMICDQEYKAWDYDTYIFDAIALAARWKPDQVSYDRIYHLRYWLRENTQHGHDLEYSHLRSMRSAKQFIDQLIHQEYPNDDLKEMRTHALKNNAEVFKKQIKF